MERIAPWLELQGRTIITESNKAVENWSMTPEDRDLDHMRAQTLGDVAQAIKNSLVD